MICVTGKVTHGWRRITRLLEQIDVLVRWPSKRAGNVTKAPFDFHESRGNCFYNLTLLDTPKLKKEKQTRDLNYSTAFLFLGML